MLGRRDPAIYGGLSLNELETQIYEWARELDMLRPLPADEQRGRVHRAGSTTPTATPTALIVNPGAWTHYS